MNALELLTQQHEAIDQLLAKLGAATDPQQQVDLVRELADEVTAHLGAEQEILYPAIGIAVADAVMDEVMLEHAAIKRTMADLLWFETDDPRFDERLATLTTLLDGHTQWQEHALFAAVASALDTDQLAALGARLRAAFVISHEIAVASAA